MRQIWIPRFGGPEVLEVRSAPDPEPGPGEVRVRVEASGVNFADCMARLGKYPDAPPKPMVVGYEVAGTIDALGDGVDGSRLGEAVVAATQFGGYSDVVVVHQTQAVRRPEGLDAVTAASIPVTGLTAWMMLHEMGRVRAGDRVLVHSAGGGVGLACLDLLKHVGATAVGTASGHKHEALYARGYDELVDYRSVDFYDALKDGPGFDLVLDPVGGESWRKGLDLLRTGGRLVLFGFSAGSPSGTSGMWSQIRAGLQVPWLRFNPVRLMNDNAGVLGVNMGHMWDERERLAGWLRELLALWEQGVLRPLVHATVPFDNAAEAHRILHARENVGKVILTP